VNRASLAAAVKEKVLPPSSSLQLPGLGEYLLVEIGRQPETTRAERVDRLADGGDKTSTFRGQEDAERPNQRNSEPLREHPGREVVEDDPLGAQLECQTDRFGFTRPEAAPTTGGARGRSREQTRSQAGRSMLGASRTTAGGMSTLPKIVSSKPSRPI